MLRHRVQSHCPLTQKKIVKMRGGLAWYIAQFRACSSRFSRIFFARADSLRGARPLAASLRATLHLYEYERQHDADQYLHLHVQQDTRTCGLA